NLGDRVKSLRDALASLARIARVERISKVYETAPVGGPPQPAYLNAAVLVAYEGEPVALLAALQGIEARVGRVRDREERWGPRIIDLDILWIEGMACESAELTVPHPRLPERAFALRPLVDVVPQAIDPWTQMPYSYLAMHAEGDVRVTDTRLALPS